MGNSEEEIRGYKEKDKFSLVYVVGSVGPAGGDSLKITEVRPGLQEPPKCESGILNSDDADLFLSL